MKILKLRFQNLNSLAGVWSIDFTAPEFINDGIFAISGPTGAGKSTIMDAICLALYGCTPRLGNITVSGNEIMSRHTGECFAEVVFSALSGSYRAHWSQRRARGKASGALQPPRHELSDLESGVVIASMLTSTKEEIVAKTGMDFRRFTQSMMLAQGGFAAFLQASANDRAPILEQITGTEIYSTISISVHEFTKKEQVVLEKLEAERKGISLMEPEERMNTETALSEALKTKDDLTSAVDRLRVTDTWLKNLKSLTGSLEQLALEEIALKNETEAFKPHYILLQNSRKTIPFHELFSALALLREQQQKEKNILENLQQQTGGFESAVHSAENSYNAAAELFTSVSEEREKLLLLTSRVRRVDEAINQQNEVVQKIRKEIDRIGAETGKNVQKKEDTIQQQQTLKLQLEQIVQYLSDHHADARLIEEMAVIKATVKKWQESSGMFANDKQALTELETSLDTIMREAAIALQDFEDAGAKLRESKEKVAIHQQKISDLLKGQTIDEINVKKDEVFLRLSGLQKIASFEEERKNLSDEKPCPLCGSLHHPFAEGNIPRVSEAEIELADLRKMIDVHRELVSGLQGLLENEKVSSKNLDDAGHACRLKEKQQEGIVALIKDKEAIAERSRLAFEQEQESVKTTMLAYDMDEIPGSSEALAAMVEILDKRKSAWMAAEAEKNTIGKNLDLSSGEISTLETLIKTLQGEEQIKIAEEADASAKLDTLTTERKELFGERSVEQEEMNSRKKTIEAGEAKDAAEKSLKEKQKIFNDHSQKILVIKNQQITRQEEIEKSTKEFTSGLQKAGIADEAEYLSYRLSDEEHKKLEEIAVEFGNHKIRLDTRRAGLEEKLREEQGKNLTAEEPGVIEEKLRNAQEMLREVLSQCGVLQEKLRRDDESRERGEAIFKQIEEQSKVCNRWNRLNRYIGSGDGRKFRNFAQGLTLEIMISYSNRQLLKLSDRYLLTHDVSEPLELKVIDNYQAGEIRSTKNLSGGEAFIVSLALALGLSGMSSRNVRVDSLFLDEGFGTLDEETLETALSTLAGLRQDGKMIGVISHVGALKERINTQIVVTPVKEGRSIISGPGCLC